MKHYEKSFSVAFILIMLGCIVFRIESWPFSDWRVYSHRMMPRHVSFYEVRAQVGDQIILPLDGNSLDLTVDTQFSSLNLALSHPKLQELCNEVIANVLRYTPADNVKVIKYQVDDNMNISETQVCFWSKAMKSKPRASQ
jgi:hypothetical protein